MGRRKNPCETTISPAGATKFPVYLLDGSLYEQAVDIRWPTPYGTWTLARTYRSNYDSTSSTIMVQHLGNNWNFGEPDMLLILSSSGDYHLMVNGHAQRIFEHQGSNVFVGPEDSFLVLTRDTMDNEVTIKDKLTRDEWLFYDDVGAVDAGYQGKLKSRTIQGGGGSASTKITYTWLSSFFGPNYQGKLSKIVLPDETDITFAYDTTTYLVESVKLDPKNGGSNGIEVYYTYEGDSGVTIDDDVAEHNDSALVQVKVRTRASDGTNWIDRYTQYRYTDDGKYLLKAIYNSSAIQAIVDAEAPTTADGVLAQADSVVADYASRAFTYYIDFASAVETDSVTTPWEVNEDLHDYLSSGVAQDITEADWVVASETINDGSEASCCGGGGGSAGLTYFYYYFESDHFAVGSMRDRDERGTYRLIVIDADQDGQITSPNSDAVKRNVLAINHRGRLIRELIIDDPTTTTPPPKYWGNSWVYHDGSSAHEAARLAERRFPSAHNISTSNVDEFLDPYDPFASSDANDLSTLRATDGLIELYEYDTDGNRTSQKIKQGKNGDGHYVAAWDYHTGTADHQKHLVVTSWEYPTKTTSKTGGVDTTYTYTFWGNNQIKTVKTLLPPVSSSTQNGPGGVPESWEYFDATGRLRWTKDPDGYIDYYSYHPDFGVLAYIARDVEPTELPAGASGNTSRWQSPTQPTSGSANSNKPGRSSALPTEIVATSASEYDSLSRLSRELPQGSNPGTVSEDFTHYTIYEADSIIRVMYWDETNHETSLPIEISLLDDAGQIIESISAAPDEVSHSSGIPTGTTASQGDYVRWVKTSYNSSGSAISRTEYHNIPASGTGAKNTHYYETLFTYDARGRLSKTARLVSGTSYQVTKSAYDVLDRPIATYAIVGASSADPTAKMTAVEYDGGGVGDGHVTKSIVCFNGGANDYVGSELKRDFRGFVRGVRPVKGTASVGPFTVTDVDWMGRTIATAAYVSEPDWSSVVSDADYAASPPATTHRRTLRETFYDGAGRVYRVKQHSINQSSGASIAYRQFDNYHDYRDNRVAHQEKNGAALEYAYDGLGRRYQERIVEDLNATKFSGVSFNYQAPVPKRSLNSLTGGDDEVIEIKHVDYDEHDQVIGRHRVEVNHNDTNGVSFTSNDYVRQTIYSWYDDANRLLSVADYGSGDNSTKLWKYKAYSGRSTAPSSSDTVHVTSFSYSDSTGELEQITDPEGKKQVTYYDDLGRLKYDVANFNNFNPATEADTGGGSDNDQDRVVKREYNGLGNVTKLTAMDQNGNGNLSDNQVTEYFYQDTLNAGLRTKVLYPRDGDDDVVFTYFRDGRLKTRTDQLGTQITYSYNNWRAVTSEDVTIVGTGIDTAVKNITRTYDDLRRPVRVTSKADIVSAVVNDVKYEYLYGTRKVSKLWQDHDSSVSGSSPAVTYSYDTASAGSVYTNGLRLNKVTYPSGNAVTLAYGTGRNDVLHRVAGLLSDHQNGTTDKIVAGYEYAGARRLMYTGLNWGSSPNEYKMYQAYDSSVSSPDGTYEGLDLFGRRKSFVWRTGSSVLEQFDYTYDRVGNRLTRDIPSSLFSTDNHDQKYAYDGLHRLHDFDEGTLASGNIGSPAKEQLWSLDAYGNWASYTEKSSGVTALAHTRAHNEANEFDDSGNVFSTTTGTDWANPAQDDAGNMTTIPVPAALTSTFTAKYDAWHRLVSLSEGSTTTTFVYDGLNRRVSKSGSQTEHYFYDDKWRCIEVRDTTDDGSTAEEYVWHPNYIDALAVRYWQTDTDGTYLDADETLYAFHDANYNVTSLASTSNVVRERYHYSPYGELAVLDPDFSDDTNNVSDFDNPYTYTGRRFDSETGLYQYRNRYYHAQLGRFVSRDPIGYVGSQWNLYEYVEGSPATFGDASGLAKGRWNKFCEACRGVYQLGPFDAWGASGKFDLGIGLGTRATSFGIEVSEDPTVVPELGSVSDIENAARHCFWSAALTVYHGEKNAKAVTDAHEYGEELSGDSLRDQFNNRVGREIGLDVAKMEKSCLAKEHEIKRRCLQAIRNGDTANSTRDRRLDVTTDDELGDASDSGSNGNVYDSSK